MRYLELITPSQPAASILEHYGRTYDFPGYGQRLFHPAFYGYTGEALWDISDPQIRDWMINWFSALFADDNSRFKPDRFADFIARHGTWGGARPRFQQRHLHYLAHAVASIGDPHIRRFVSDWVADLCRSTNANFKPDRWKQFAEPDAHSDHAADEVAVDEGEVVPYRARTEPRELASANAGDDPYLHEHGWRRDHDCETGAMTVYHHPKDPRYTLLHKKFFYNLYGPPGAKHGLIGSYPRPHLAHQAFLRASNAVARNHALR